MRIKVAPSLLSADFSRLADEIRKVTIAGADMLHIDVMDGHFVPNLTIGPVVVKSIRRITKLPLDVHLMIMDPVKYADAFVDAGSDMITVHIETVSRKDLLGLKAKLRLRKVKLGISLNPATPMSKVLQVLDVVDFVLVMSVNPGFGGQRFIPEVLPKIKKLRENFSGDISIDGGINEETGLRAVEAGANILAAGSYIFHSKDYKETIRRLKEHARNS